MEGRNIESEPAPEIGSSKVVLKIDPSDPNISEEDKDFLIYLEGAFIEAGYIYEGSECDEEDGKGAFTQLDIRFEENGIIIKGRYSIGRGNNFKLDIAKRAKGPKSVLYEEIYGDGSDKIVRKSYENYTMMNSEQSSTYRGVKNVVMFIEERMSEK